MLYSGGDLNKEVKSRLAADVNRTSSPNFWIFKVKKMYGTE